MSRLERIHQNKSSQLVHERTKEEKAPARSPRLIYFFIFILFAALIYLVFFSGTFNVRRKEIIGYNNPALIEEIIESHTGAGILNNNLLFFRSRDLADSIKGDSGVRSVKVTKIYPDKIKVIIEESTASINWNTAGDNFVVDDRGYVIEKNNIPNLPQVYDNANIEVDLGERVASPTFIKFVNDVSESFEPITGQKVDRIIIFDILSEVHVKSAAGWTVYMDTSRDPVKQLENLSRVLASAKKSGHKKLQYIDMRLDNKVYYK